jgi:hypothetical protein
MACAAVRPDLTPKPALEPPMAAAIDAVTFGGIPIAVVGNLRLSRTHAGAIRVFAGESPWPAGLGDRAADVRIASWLAARFSADPLLADLGLDVDVEDGVVILSGDGGTGPRVAHAVRIALGAAGVKEVLSRLVWLRRP